MIPSFEPTLLSSRDVRIHGTMNESQSDLNFSLLLNDERRKLVIRVRTANALRTGYCRCVICQFHVMSLSSVSVIEFFKSLSIDKAHSSMK